MQSDGIVDGAASGANYICRWRLAIRRKRECSEASERRWQKTQSGWSRNKGRIIFNREEIKC
jgi:hypothetical protein